jgi:hypothetical protein
VDGFGPLPSDAEPARSGGEHISVIVPSVQKLNLVGPLWRKILRDRDFLWVCGALLWFNFAWQMSWPLFNIYQIQTAHAPALWIALINVASQTGQTLSYRWWGRMAERFGNGMVIVRATFGMALASRSHHSFHEHGLLVRGELDCRDSGGRYNTSVVQLSTRSVSGF